jgi:hypothetical protein
VQNNFHFPAGFKGRRKNYLLCAKYTFSEQLIAICRTHTIAHGHHCMPHMYDDKKCSQKMNNKGKRSGKKKKN